MTREEWERSDDPSELLSHAALHIPRRHLCLVLAELAQRAAAAWERAHPDEWRLAWGIAVVRAWCFFEADDDDLERAQQALAPLRPGANGRDERGFAAGECVARLLEVTCWPTRPPLPPRSFGLEEEPRAFARSATLVARHAVWAAGGGALAQARTMAALIRQRVLFTAHTEREWLPSPGLVFAGQAVLRIDGWALGDIVARADFSQLSAERSVAFDQAQQEAAPESDALVAHRAFVRECIEQREAQAKKDAAIMARGGCVGSEVISNGQAFRRIACFAPPTPTPPPPPPVDIERVDPLGVLLLARRNDQCPTETAEAYQRSLRVSATEAWKARGRKALSEAEFKALDAARERLASERRKAAAKTVIDTDWAPGWTWLWALLSAALVLGVLGVARLLGASGPDITLGVGVVFAMGAGVFGVVLHSVEPRPKDGDGPAGTVFGLMAMGALIAFIVLNATEWLASSVLRLADVETPSELERLRRGHAWSTKQVAEDALRARESLDREARAAIEDRKHDHERRGRLLARLRPTSPEAETLSALLACAPLLLFMAWVMSYLPGHTLAWHLVRSIERDRTPLFAYAAGPRRAPRPGPAHGRLTC